MFGGPNHVLIAAVALLSMGHVSSQCITARYVWWYPCGYHTDPQTCGDALLVFNIHKEANVMCVVEPDRDSRFHGTDRDQGSCQEHVQRRLWGDVSDDQLTLTFNMGEVDQGYDAPDSFYYWSFELYLDNCDTSYTWDDNFVQLSYVDEEQNTTDLSAFEDADYIDEADTGICPTPSPTTPVPVTDANPAPPPSPTADGSGPLALGCYEDDRQNRIMDDLALSDYTMTTEVI
ncbi:unnamed protein product [Ectocarpus sp. CCAP 1310/34]|nr:unnamed protein product [Ectocarpus sp. CCAP 1310/34]